MYSKIYRYQDAAENEVCSKFHSEYISTHFYYAQSCYGHYQNDNFLIQVVLTEPVKINFS
ncbi:hypothetical protein Hdeb2414_s0018g00515861 [Helianthus debilis subsp. tardiflorus]